MKNTIITVSRCYGSGGRSIGKMISQTAGIPCYDRNLIYLASSASGIDPEDILRNDERVKKDLFNIEIPDESNRYVSKEDIFLSQSRVIRDLADKSDCIIIGRCADHLLKNSKHNVLRVFVWAPEHVCKDTVMKKFNVSEAEAAKTIRRIDRHRSDYYRYHTGREWNDAKNYDLCIDTSRFDYDRAAEVILACARGIFPDCSL